MIQPKKMSKLCTIVFSVFWLLLLSTTAKATLITYQMNLDGAQEAPVGDPDGTAAGTISFDDVTGLVSWDLTYANILLPVAMHVHGPLGFAGINAGVFFSMGVATSGGANTLIDSTNISLANISVITAAPTGFYINIHTPDFPPGAVRGQLGNIVNVPEPSTIAIFVFALMGLGLRSFKKR